MILDDALANSFVAPATDDIQDDHQLTCKYLKWFPAFFKVDKWQDFLTDAVNILVMDKDVDIDCFIEHHGDVGLTLNLKFLIIMLVETTSVFCKPRVFYQIQTSDWI